MQVMGFIHGAIGSRDCLGEHRRRVKRELSDCEFVGITEGRSGREAGEVEGAESLLRTNRDAKECDHLGVAVGPSSERRMLS